MTDISKCNGFECPIRDKCYRYTGPSGIWQSYNNYVYDNGCDDFIDNKDRQRELIKQIIKKDEEDGIYDE